MWHVPASASSEDGRLCAAAFVQDRRSYTGCTDAPNPSGGSGRAWCYVEAQACSAAWVSVCMAFHDWFRELLGSEPVAAAWDFCAPAVDYDVARKEMSAIFDAKITEVQAIVAKLLQTQRAGEQALDKYCWWRCVLKTVGKIGKNIVAGTRGHVPLRLCRRLLQLLVEEGPRACSLHCFLLSQRVEKNIHKHSVQPQKNSSATLFELYESAALDFGEQTMCVVAIR